MHCIVYNEHISEMYLNTALESTAWTETEGEQEVIPTKVPRNKKVFDFQDVNIIYFL